MYEEWLKTMMGLDVSKHSFPSQKKSFTFNCKGNEWLHDETQHSLGCHVKVF